MIDQVNGPIGALLVYGETGGPSKLVDYAGKAFLDSALRLEFRD